MKKASLTEQIKGDLEQKQKRPEVCEKIEKADDCSLTYYGVEIKTAEQLLESQGIDLRIWEVVEQRINNWEVTGKRSLGMDKDRRWQGDELWKTGNRQITVKLRRLAPKPIQDAIRGLLKEVVPLSLSRSPKRPKEHRHLMELGLHDIHFAKLCYGVETGTNYDLRIAEEETMSAIDRMIERAAGFNVERIHLPVGSDFCHYNSEEKTTANFTPMATSADDRLTKAFRVMCRVLQYAIEKCLTVAPVDVIYIAGNHDRTIAWFLTEWIAAKFDHTEDVTILNSPTHRKYVAYGPSLLGYTHGDEVPADKLPGLMAQERPDLWAASTFRSWRTGHFHKKKQTRYIAGDTHNGVEVYVFPSLCGTDSWHYRKGFVGNARMAEVHFWSEIDGPAGMFYVHAKEPRVALMN